MLTMHQVTLRVEQPRTALDAQQRLQSDVIQQAGQVVTHGPGKGGRFLGGLFRVFERGTLTQLFTRFVQGTAGLLQARRDAAQHDAGTGIDVIERRIERNKVWQGYPR